MILRTWGKNRQSRLNLSPVCSRKRGLLPASNTCCGEANLKRAVESVVLRHFGNILASKLLPRIRCDPGGFGTVQTGKWVGKRKSRILIRRNVRKQTARTQNEIKAREAYFNRDANCWINLQVYAPPGDNLSAGYVTLYLKAEARRRKFFTVFTHFFPVIFTIGNFFHQFCLQNKSLYIMFSRKIWRGSQPTREVKCIIADT